MKKSSRFIAGFLSAVLAVHSVGVYGEEIFTQPDNGAMRQEETDGQLNGGEIATVEPDAGDLEDWDSEKPGAGGTGAADAYFVNQGTEDFSGIAGIDEEEAFTDGEDQDHVQEEAPEEKGFMDDVNLSETQGALNEEQPAEFYMTDEVEAPVEAADGMPSGTSLFSAGYYSGSYGEQLDDEAGNLYTKLVERYVTNYQMGLSEPDYADLEANLLDRIYFDVSLGEDGKIIQDENFGAARAQLKYIVQAAVDAFSYDHPEVFWFRGCNYTFSYGYTRREDGSCQGYISSSVKLQLGIKEIETDAHKDMGAFMASVENTASMLQEKLENASIPEKAEEIHDYICRLATYKGADDPGNLVVHSARPAFLGTDHGFVCEGYAKTMKILCDRLGVNCACVSGPAKSASSGTAGPHMWNYVQLEDGKWYLVDATWDDTKDPEEPYNTYLMAGWNSQGFYIKIREERTENCDLSASQGMQFIFPQIEEELYHTDQYHKWTRLGTDKAPSCIETGSGSYRCTVCGKTETRAIPALGHEMERIGEKAPTCIAQGNREYWKCVRCGKFFSDVQGTEETTEEDMKQPLGDHSWELEQRETEPSCTESGRETSRCIFCGEIKTEDIPAAGHKLTRFEAKASSCTAQGNREYWKCARCGKFFSDAQGTKETTEAAMKLPLVNHSYGVYQITKAATALEEGVKTAACRYCGHSVTVSVSRLTPAVKLNASALTLKVRQSFTIKASGLVSGDRVVKWKSDKTKIASVNSKGKVTGRKKGTATITVTLASGLSKKIKVKVQNGTVKTTKIKLNIRKVTLAKKGKTYKLSATVSPVTSQQKISYASSNTKVAAVNSKGKITAKRKGTAVITVRSGSRKATCKVTVKK